MSYSIKLAIACMLALAVTGEALAQERPPSPFLRVGEKGGSRKSGTPVEVSFSDGSNFKNPVLHCKPGKQILVLPENAKKRVAVKISEISVLRQTVMEEQLEREWRWREGGFQEKIYTGRSYPWRKYILELTLKNGSVVKGRLTSGFPLLVEHDVAGEDGAPVRKKSKIVIKPRNKGKMGTTLEQLVYVKEIRFTDGK